MKSISITQRPWAFISRIFYEIQLPMGRVVVEKPMSTRNARGKLSVGLYWRYIDPNVHLGYRKSVRGGFWLVRWRGGKGYLRETLGTADDAVDADGTKTLTFAQAESAARRHVAALRLDEALKAAGPILTVQTAVDEYISEREAREATYSQGTAKKRDARSSLYRYVVSDSTLATLAVGKLSVERLTEWRSSLPSKLAPTTRTRVASDFKAALNRAARIHRQRLPNEIEITIRHGFKADKATSAKARPAQILTTVELRRVVIAAKHVDREGGWEGDLARMVLALAATGARFSQLARMVVSDVQPENGRLMVPVSNKGRGTKQIPKTARLVGEDVLAELKPLMNDRSADDFLFIRPRREQISPTVWKKVSREPWLSPSELARPWRLIISMAKLPANTVPYALRHTSIVGMLKAGLHVRLVAALHDTSSGMIERHYSAFIVDAMTELAAKAIVRLTEPNVVDAPA